MGQVRATGWRDTPRRKMRHEAARGGVALLGFIFLFAFIPSLSKHLRARYGAQYEKWERETSTLIPFVY